MWDGAQDEWESYHAREQEARLKDFMAGWGAAEERLQKPIPFDQLKPGRYWAKFHPRTPRAIDRWKPVEIVYHDTEQRLVVRALNGRWQKDLEEFAAFIPQYLPSGRMDHA